MFCFALLLSIRTLCTSYHPKGAFQTLLPITSWYWSHQGKHNAVKHWMEQRVTYLDKRQSKISFNSGCWSPVASGSLSKAEPGQFAYAHPSSAAVEEPCPSPCWPAVGLTRCHMTHILKQNKGTYIELATGKDIHMNRLYALFISW